MYYKEALWEKRHGRGAAHGACHERSFFRVGDCSAWCCVHKLTLGDFILAGREFSLDVATTIANQYCYYGVTNAKHFIHVMSYKLRAGMVLLRHDGWAFAWRHTICRAGWAPLRCNKPVQNQAAATY